MPVKRAAAGPSDPTKRTRFASPAPSSTSPFGAGGTASGSRSTSASASGLDADDYLEDDIPQGGATARLKARKSLKDQDGYGSDSSNENDEGVVPSRRGKDGAGGDGEDDDMDMFGDDVDEVAKGKGKEGGKKKEFLDMKDIEGQELGETGTRGKGYDDGESEDEDMGPGGLDGDMGVEITPFNMKNEMSEGRFTADGEAYVANDEDPNDKHDTWLDDVDGDEIKKARRAHRERERAEREKEEREAGGGEEKSRREEELLGAAVGLMERGETVLEALQRLGKEVEAERRKKEAGGKKKSWAERQKERKAQMATEEEQSDSIHTSNPFTNLSNIVSGLTTVGHLDVYSLSRESIQRMLPQSDSAPQRQAAPPPPPADTRQFQYRFSLAYMRSLPEGQRPVEREIFGPFSSLQLRGWRGTGFFGSPACENVELRVVSPGGESGPWGSWAEVVEQGQ
ncbi:hypothetical protein IAT38_006676 [Cryptococcus sp. DSM 104549]